MQNEDKKKKNSVISVNFSQNDNVDYIPVFTASSNKKWIRTGTNDKYFENLLTLSNSSATHSSILNLKKNSINGNGFDGSQDFINFIAQQDFKQNGHSILEKIANSLSIFDGYYLQVIYNITGEKIKVVKPIPFQQIRVGQVDATGTILSFFHCLDWSNPTGKNTPTEYPAFDPEIASKHPQQIYYYFVPNAISEFYPIPSYTSAIDYIETEDNIGKIIKRSARNSFLPSGLVNVPDMDSPEERAEYVENFINEHQGAETTNRLIFNFYNDPNNMTSVVPIMATNNYDHFIFLSSECEQKICTAHQLPDKSLAGINDVGASLGGDANTIKVAFDIYQNSKINSYQTSICKTFQEILKNQVDVTGINIIKYSPVTVEDIPTSNAPLDTTTTDTQNPTIQ